MSTRQLTLELPCRPALGRDDFVVSQTNREAVAWLDRWPDWPHHALIVTGPKGSGKTHLAACWCHAASARRIDAGQLSGQLVRESQQGTIFAVEDLDAGPFDEQALFDLLNIAQASGGSLLLTARRGIAHWHVRLADLMSRLRAAPHVALGGVDDALLRAVLVKLFADRQLAVEARVLDYMIKRMRRSLEHAQALVDALDRRALAAGRPISRSLAAEVLAAADTGTGERY